MYSVDENDKVVELEDVPQSDAGAPSPIVLSSERVLVLAYLIQRKPYVFDGRVLTDEDIANLRSRVALVEFAGYYAYMFGPPNDEAFAGHPLFSRGLRPYGAFEVKSSSWIRQLERMNSVHSAHKPGSYGGLHHYVFAFHDSTFECVADGYSTTELVGRDVLQEMQMRLKR